MLPFKEDGKHEEPHRKVKHIPSIKDSHTGKRHAPGLLVATHADNMEVKQEKPELQVLSEIEAAK